MFSKFGRAIAPKLLRSAFKGSTLVGAGLLTLGSVAYAQNSESTPSDDTSKISATEPNPNAVPNLTSVKNDLKNNDKVNIPENNFDPNKQPEKGKITDALNEETGEIDWDCPCLGGMAHGPCGEEFKQAFACFIFSTSEIKGAECLSKFGAMQSCFKKHPEVYNEFLTEEDE